MFFTNRHFLSSTIWFSVSQFVQRTQDKCWFFPSKYLLGFWIVGVERNDLLFLKVLTFKNKNVIQYFYETKKLRFNILTLLKYNVLKEKHLCHRLWINDFFQKLNIPCTQQPGQKPEHYLFPRTSPLSFPVTALP